MTVTYRGIPIRPTPIPSIEELSALETVMYAPNLPMSETVLVCNRNPPHQSYMAKQLNDQWVPAALVGD